MTCLGAFGRMPAGAQARLGVLMRPKHPSSWAIFKTGRLSSAERVATAAATLAGKFLTVGARVTSSERWYTGRTSTEETRNEDLQLDANCEVLPPCHYTRPATGI